MDVAATPQPDPLPNTLPPLWNLVIADMRSRDEFGREKYKTPLQPNNGRDALADAYQESLDLCVYLRQAIWERDECNLPVDDGTEAGVAAMEYLRAVRRRTVGRATWFNVANAFLAGVEWQTNRGAEGQSHGQ